MDLSKYKKPDFQGDRIKTLDPAHLINVALEIWRLQKKLSKLNIKVDKKEMKPILYSIDSCVRNLTEMGIETKDDYTGNTYKSSMNVDIVSYEAMQMESADAIVKETLEPAILFQNTLIHKAKVIITTPTA